MRGSRRSNARRLRPRGAARERHQRNVARALDGHAEPALVPRANSGHAPRQNLAALLDELRKNVGSLVVDEVHLLDAELTDFLFAKILALAARTASRPTGSASRAAFAPWAAMPAAGTAFAPSASRATAVRLPLFLFLGHTFLPFSLFRKI